jgi:putative hemolysin
VESTGEALGRHIIDSEGDHTMQSTYPRLLTVFFICGMLAACNQAQQPTPAPTQAGLPNPASVYCEGQGGRLEIRA